MKYQKMTWETPQVTTYGPISTLTMGGQNKQFGPSDGDYLNGVPISDCSGPCTQPIVP